MKGIPRVRVFARTTWGAWAFLLGSACASGESGGSSVDTGAVGSNTATSEPTATNSGVPTDTGAIEPSAPTTPPAAMPPTQGTDGQVGVPSQDPTGTGTSPEGVPAGAPAVGTCAEGITTGTACQLATDSQMCELSSQHCSCGGDPAIWSCTPNPQMGGEPPMNAGMGGAGGEEGASDPGGSAHAGAGGMGGGGMEPGAETWLGVWAGAPQLTEPHNNPPTSLANNTLRQLAYVSFGGSEVRLQLSNEFGDGPVTINKVHIAQSASGSGIVPGTDVGLTFGGSESVTLNQGEAVHSDAIEFELPELSSVAITMHFGNVPQGITGHPGSRTTSYIASGDAVSNETLTGATTTDHWYYISRFEVMAPESAGAIVCLGDSLTDGRGSTTNENNRWPDALARRLRSNPATPLVSVVNVGIGGNNVVRDGLGPPGLERFDRDVLGTANVRWVLIMEGVNDIGSNGEDPAAVIAAYQELIDKAHAAGVLAYGIPILPMKGHDYYSSEAKRQQINEWIRTSGAFDAVLDLDEAVADPNDAERIRDGFHDGDSLHLSPEGYQALADAIDLSLFVIE